MKYRKEKPKNLRLVNVVDCRGDEVTVGDPPRPTGAAPSRIRIDSRADWQAVHRPPLDAPRDSLLPDGFGQGWNDLPPTDYAITLRSPGLGRVLIASFTFAVGFLAGLMVGRW